MIISDLNILETVTAENVIGGCRPRNSKYNDRYEEDKKYKKEEDKKYKNDEDKKYKYDGDQTLTIVQETDVKVTVTPNISIY